MSIAIKHKNVFVKHIKIYKWLIIMVDKRLNIFLKKMEISKKKLSNDTDVHYNSILKYTDGSIKPGLDFLTKLFEVYKLNLNWLVSGEGAMICENLCEDPYDADLLKYLVMEKDEEYRTTDINLREKIVDLIDSQNISLGEIIDAVLYLRNKKRSAED